MRTLRGMKLELQNLGYMKGILETYEEMAATQMSHIRGDLGHAKNYYDGLAEVSHEIGVDIVSVVGQDTVISAMVLLSSNTGMFGSLTQKVVENFAAEIRDKTCDVFVIGEMGAKLLKMALPSRNFQVLSLPKEEFRKETMEMIIDQLRVYRQIKIFYGKFVNIVRQEPTSRKLAGELTLTSLSSEDRSQKLRQLKYLYEPSVEEVSNKISREIFANIFEETTRESTLGKYAARLMHLDQSLSNLDEIQRKMHKGKVQWRRKLDNKKQGLRAAASLGGRL